LLCEGPLRPQGRGRAPPHIDPRTPHRRPRRSNVGTQGTYRRSGVIGMCELLMMSSRIPATVNLELGVLARHGGGEGPERDGWGIAYYQDNDVRLIKDAAPAYESPWVGFVAGLALRSKLVIAHIRRATSGTIALRNTHPFTRELSGRMHVFAHNGAVP